MDHHPENRIMNEDARNAVWEQMYEVAKQYYITHGDLDVPSNYVTQEGVHLGPWLIRQRNIRSGKRKGIITEERIRRLDAIGMSWLDLAEERWNRNFRALRAYYEQYGDLDVPQNYVTTDGLHLGQFVKNVRHLKDTKYRRCLTPSRVIMLTEMGMIWDVNEYRWKCGYDHAKAYFTENGNLITSKRYTSPDGFKLGIWLTYQRGKRDEGELSEERIEMLDAIGMVWSK